MTHQFIICKSSKVRTEGDTIYIERDSKTLMLTFLGLETIEALENNLSHIANGIRAERTMKEGVESGLSDEDALALYGGN